MSLVADAAQQFIHEIGTGTVVHNSGELFSDHLVSVQRVLEGWNVGKDLELAGLYHSIYGTEGFQDFCLSLNRRSDVRKLIGERAEFVCYANCVMDRTTLDAALDAAPGERWLMARPDVGGERIALTEQQFTDLITVHLADWLEQIEREAAKVNERHGWHKLGDAWGYRRRAYRKMAELLQACQGPALAAYDEVFAREPSHTKHIQQDVTPALLAPIKPKVYVE